ncbi:MAG TPA: amidase family protein [Pseudolabrys sp.]|nr:amidase family protein [Pseudolabrys sp.]
MTRPTDRLEAALASIDSHGSQGRLAFTEVLTESAKREAFAADRRAASGMTKSAVDGRIVSVKALFDVTGSVTHAGSARLRQLAPAVRDADVVDRLRAAGAIIIGKTQMTEFAFSALGTNPHDGMPANPRDPARVPGGSSSGAVVSVVEGMADIAIGSDTGGSIRIPAALSGAVGFKPTGGRIPTKGAFSLSSTLDTVGPIARSVADCAAADQILSGVSPTAPFNAAVPGDFRLVVGRGRLFTRCEDKVLDAFERAIAMCRAAGIVVEDGSLDPVLEYTDRIDKLGTFPSIEVGATLSQLGISSLDGIDPLTRARIEANKNVSAVDYVLMTRHRQAAIDSFGRLLRDNEIVIVPTTPIVAPLISSVTKAAAFHEANGLVLRNPRVANLLDCPSVSIPVPGPGLPVGLMLLGQRNSDRRLLSAAARIELSLRQLGEPL